MTFNYENTDLEPIEKDIYLSPIEEGATAVLENIFFDIAKSELRKESQTELDKVVRFLKANPDAKIEISGHTDNTGEKGYNYNLSLKKG